MPQIADGVFLLDLLFFFSKHQTAPNPPPQKKKMGENPTLQERSRANIRINVGAQMHYNFW